MKPFFSTSLLALSLLATSAVAGPVSDFETALRSSYGAYRTALFATNTGDKGKSAKTLAAFDKSWADLVATYKAAPPPQYVDDAQWNATLEAVKLLVDQASADVDQGDLAKAHEALEGVRGQIGNLHERNGIISFSDRMNAYHAEMEEVLALDLATATPTSLAEKAGVLAYLAREILRLPAPEAASAAEYAPLQAAFAASVAAFTDAVASGDAAAIAAAVGGLKVPYSKFFVMFG